MKRRTLLQWLASIAAMLPLDRLRVFAQPRELTPEAIATLHEIAATVLPASLGSAQVRRHGGQVRRVDARLSRRRARSTHGYGHPRLRQIAGVAGPGVHRAARRARRGGAREGRALERARSRDAPRAARRLVRGGGRAQRCRRGPIGQHVVADLMAFYFRSSEANDDCYSALINREVCRPIAITTQTACVAETTDLEYTEIADYIDSL